MEQRLRDIEKTVVVIISDIDNLKAKMTRVESIEKEISDIKATVARMEMIDNNIIEKLSDISLIDKRLKSLEKVLYMGIGAGVLLQAMHTFKIFGALQ